MIYISYFIALHKCYLIFSTLNSNIHINIKNNFDLCAQGAQGERGQKGEAGQQGQQVKTCLVNV